MHYIPEQKVMSPSNTPRILSESRRYRKDWCWSTHLRGWSRFSTMWTSIFFIRGGSTLVPQHTDGNLRGSRYKRSQWAVKYATLISNRKCTIELQPTKANANLNKQTVNLPSTRYRHQYWWRRYIWGIRRSTTHAFSTISIIRRLIRVSPFQHAGVRLVIMRWRVLSPIIPFVIVNIINSVLCSTVTTIISQTIIHSWSTPLQLVLLHNRLNKKNKLGACVCAQRHCRAHSMKSKHASFLIHMTISKKCHVTWS